MKFVIPGELPDLNQIIEASKSHYGAYSKMKKKNTELVAWCSTRLPSVEYADIEVHWYCKNKRKDKDNIRAGLKFILDGLVQANVLKNDGWKQVGDLSDKFLVDKNNPRIEVILYAKQTTVKNN
jgi:Holliday junction resolvase RusA-like endonuclease